MTDLTEAETFEILSAINNPGDFIVSILTHYPKRGWSERQFSCAKQTAERELKRRAFQVKAKAPEVSTESLDIIQTVLQRARDNGKKYPFLILLVEESGEEQEYRVSLTGDRSKRPGAVTINNVTKDEWVGYISDEGTLGYGTPELHKTLAEFSSDLWNMRVASEHSLVIGKHTDYPYDAPRAAQSYARRTGQCMFCKKELTVGESKDRSYGPKCAANHGLPFDYKRYARQTASAANPRGF